MTPIRIALQITNSELYSASRRLLEERQPLAGFSNDIAGTSYRANQRFQARRVYFFAQAADMDVAQISSGVKVITPDLFENHHARQDLAAVPHHKLQTLEFAGQQARPSPVEPGFAADQVAI